MIKTLISLLLFVSGLAAQPSLSNTILLTNNGVRPSVALTAAAAAANSGHEVLFDRAVGGCWHQFNMSLTGTNVTDMTATVFSGLPSITTRDTGNGSYSPDGNWVLMQGQDASTTLACNSSGDPGGGFGNDLFACHLPDGACTALTVEGDNSGHFCTGANYISGANSGSSPWCHVLNTLVTYVNDGKGAFSWHFTPDMTKVYGMYIMGAGSGQDENLRGMLRYCTFNATTPPTIGGCWDFDIYPGDGTGRWNFYEGAGALPLVDESPGTCTIFSASNSVLSGAATHQKVLRANMCTGAWKYITPDNCYDEFWAIDPTGTYGVGASSCKSPISSTWQYSPMNFLEGMAAQAGSGAGPVALTLFNPYVGTYIFSHPAWSWDGHLVYNVTIPSTSIAIYRSDFSRGGAAVITQGSSLKNEVIH